MTNAIKTLLISTAAFVCFSNIACFKNPVNAQNFASPKFGGHHFGTHRQNHASHRGDEGYRSAAQHRIRFHQSGSDNYGHDNYHRPIVFRYGGYHWNRGYNGHEVADIVRSRAAANLVNAQARTQNEVARSARMDNSVKALQTHIARRAMNTQVRFGHLHAQGDRVRAIKAEAVLVAHQTGLDLTDEANLTAEEINAVTGRLHWPLLLQMEHFNNARKPVNEIFASRAHTGQVNPDHYLPLCDWIEKVSDELTKHVQDYPKADYAEAQGFLRRLLVEARLPAAANTSVQFAAK